MALTLLVRPVYESEASVRVRLDREQGLSGGLGELGDALPMGISLPGLGQSDVQTEMGVLASRRIVEAVADSLALHVELLRPRRGFRTSVLRVLEAGEDAPRGVYTLRREEDGTYSVSARGTRRPVEAPERVTVGSPFRLGPMQLELEPSLAEDPPRLVRFRVRPFRRMIRDLRKDLKVQRDDAGSRLVVIRYRHPDPHLAQGLVNGIVERFLDYSERTNKSDSRREVDILSEQVRQYAERLQESERRLQAYQELERIVAPEEQATQQVRRIAELQVTHDALEVERRALAGLLDEIAAGEPTPGAETPYRRLATFPSFITNGAVQELLQALTELENERAELLVQRTPDNLDVRMVQGRIREIEEQIFALATDYLDGLQAQIGSAGSSLATFGRELEAIPSVELEYARLTRERRLVSNVYVVLQGRLAEAQVQEEIDQAGVQVVDLGVIEDRPAFPRPEISLVLGGALALLVGLFGVVAAETTDRTVRSRWDAEAASGAPVSAVVPVPAVRRQPSAGLLNGGDPWDPATEAWGALAMGLRSLSPAPRSVVVACATSHGAPAAELALALSRQGVRVALVDADLRAGTLHQSFGVPAGPGWHQRARSGGALEEAVHEVAGHDGAGMVALLPGSDAPANALEVLTSERARAFLAEVRDRYEMVVFHARWREGAHDAALLAPLADGVLLVARSGTTRKEALAAMAADVRRAGSEVLGIVLEDRERGRPRVWLRRRRG